MFGKKGVTLIELLIVVTILSILAGAAIPYVQDYVEDARIGRAKADIDEIRNALARYEVERGRAYVGSTIASLVGPFLSKALVDPWGAPYVVQNGSSTVFSKGQDGFPGTADDVAISFRPPMAVSRIYWLDSNQNGAVDLSDSVNFKCTRGILAAAPTTAGLTSSSNSTLTTPGQRVGTNNNIASFAVTANFFVPGSDTFTINANLNNLQDLDSRRAGSDTLTILAQ